MKNFVVCILVVLLLPVPSFSQLNNYWVKFKDKNNNPFSLSNPQQFLSQRSIDRRSQQGLSLDSTDLPLTPAYVDSVCAYSNLLVHRLKWDNLVVVTIDSPQNVNIIKNLPFVDTMGSIEYYPSRSVQNKFENALPVNQDIVYPNTTYGAAYRQIQMLNGDLLHQLGYRGQGIIISMMDNGLYGADQVHVFDSAWSKILLTWNFVFNQPYIYNDGGHGVETFSCIAGNVPGKFLGTAPDANFFLFQTEQNDAEWVMEEYNWADAAEMADSAGAQIFSTSLGYTQFDNPIGSDTIDPISSHTYADLSGDKTVITHAGNQAFGKGILVFNSAGNEGNQGWHYIAAPADGDSILAIAAVDSADTIASFSSYGPNAAGLLKPDLSAMGSSSAVISIANNNGKFSYSIGNNSGTSFSCPILAGCAASLWSAFPEKSARDIKTAIVVSADRFWEPNNQYGYGIPNFYNAYLLLATNYNGSLLHADNNVTVYPNPFTNELNISLFNFSQQTHTVELFDMMGQRVFTTSFFARTGTFSMNTIDGLGGLASGEYFFRFDGNNSTVQVVVKL